MRADVKLEVVGCWIESYAERSLARPVAEQW